VVVGAVERELGATPADGDVVVGATVAVAGRERAFVGRRSFAGALSVGADVVVADGGGSGVGTGIGAVDVRVVGRDAPPSSFAAEEARALAFVAVNPAGGSSGAGCGALLAATADAGDASTTMQQPASAISRHRR
jgi:hypothetical protein